MKILLSTLNSKFIHTNLAIRYLKHSTDREVAIEEFTINQPKEYIYGKIIEKDPDILGFSVYIWNRKETLAICEMLKRVRPGMHLILGGPEVSFDSRELMEKAPYIDVIIRHEGEATFPELLDTLIDDGDLSGVLGITYREGNHIYENPDRPLISNLDSLPFPYEEGEDLKNRIIYYESSRGCPFHCQFCLSSTIQGLRFLSIERIKRDLLRLIRLPVRQIKFVDRTFNAAEEEAMEIMSFLMEHAPEGMNFHFEVTAHLVSDRMLEFLKKAPKGMFQLEIGIQSTHPRTIERIGRTTDFRKLRETVKTIKSYGNIHQHVDLILGLPYEGMKELRKSFNDTYELGAEKIQVGFLKLLRGSGLRRDADDLGLIYDPNPPYEILATPWMSARELVRLKAFEEVVERFINEEYFAGTNEFLIRESRRDPFEFFYLFSGYWLEKGYHDRAIGRRECYRILYEYGLTLTDKAEELREFLVLDFGKSQGKLLNLPNGPHSLTPKRSLWHDIIREMTENDIVFDPEENRVKELVKRALVLDTPKIRPNSYTVLYTPGGGETKEFIWKKKER